MKPNWFIGWPVAAPLLERATAAPPSVRLFAPSDLHATLAFLGGCAEARARVAFRALDAAAAAPVRIRFGAVELFGHPRRGTALSATLRDGREELAERIVEQRAAAFEAAGARPETRPPRPHVTLGRIARRASRAEREAALEWAAHIDLEGLEATVDELALYTWSDERPRVQFRVVESLRGPADS